MRSTFLALIFLLTSPGSIAAKPHEPSLMKECTAQQIDALVWSLNEQPFARLSDLASLELGECRQYDDNKILVFSAFLPESGYLTEEDRQNKTNDEIQDRNYSLVSGVFDTNKNVLSTHVEKYYRSGWVETGYSNPEVIPSKYVARNRIVFAATIPEERPGNAADGYTDNNFVLLMKHGSKIKPVLQFPLSNGYALSSGGICCADFGVSIRRTLMLTGRNSNGMPDFIIKIDRDVWARQENAEIPRRLREIPGTSWCEVKFDGISYKPTQGAVCYDLPDGIN